MQTVEQLPNAHSTANHPSGLALDLLLSGAGALVCLAVCAALWRTNLFGLAQPGDVVPYLYVLEMLGVALLGLWGAYRARRQNGRLWALVPWAAGGATAGFSLLGAFSIGLAFAPVAVLLSLGALAGDVRRRHRPWGGLGMLALAAVAQTAAMLALVAIH